MESDQLRLVESLADVTATARISREIDLLQCIAHSSLGQQQQAATAWQQVNSVVEHGFGSGLNEVHSSLRASSDPIAQHVFALDILRTGIPDVQATLNALSAARAAVGARPKCGQFWNVLGIAEYHSRNFDEAFAAWEHSRDLLQEQADAQSHAKTRMRLMRSVLDSSVRPEVAFAKFDYAVKDVLPCFEPLTGEPGAQPVAPVVMAATDRYLAWFTEAWEARTLLYMALAHHRLGAKKEAEAAYAEAMDLLAVRPDPDIHTLAVWAEAALQLGPSYKR